ncbi:hypothetical protein [Nonomuraea sp. NPDC049784]|uniref:hypothetical protein n=1 Tax=Nonomuraea sp. NPDC049784 TaxID=3154361 RepID=UPI0033F2752D
MATSVAFAVIVAVGIPRGHDRSGQKPARNGFAIAARDRVLLAALLFLLIGLLLYAQASYALPLALAANGLPASLYGLLITVNGAIVVIFQPLFIAWLSRLPACPSSASPCHAGSPRSRPSSRRAQARGRSRRRAMSKRGR